ncbi:hypothetical protein Dimus_019146 [Dionaea muscipula]
MISYQSMEGRCGFVRGGSSGWKALRNEEFEEQEMWDVMEQISNTGFKVSSPKGSNPLVSRQLPSAARMIPRAKKPNQEPRVMMQQRSAPVNIPDWSKIYGQSPVMSSSNGSYRGGGPSDEDDDDDDDEEEEEEDGCDDLDGGRLPPHEWLAKKLARDQISSFSVCEGAGRTLKGRDLSRVRHSILTKTGFI